MDSLLIYLYLWFGVNVLIFGPAILIMKIAIATAKGILLNDYHGDCHNSTPSSCINRDTRHITFLLSERL